MAEMQQWAEALKIRYPQFDPVSRAPKFEVFQQLGENDPQRVEKLMTAEGQKRYTSYDSRIETVYLVQNPALITWQAWLRKPVIYRPAKRFHEKVKLGTAKALTNNFPKEHRTWGAD